MKISLLTEYPRLATLLDALCEQRLDQSQAEELQLLLQSVPGAIELYVHYLSLHASLEWDLGCHRSGLSAVPDQELKLLVDGLLQEAEFETLSPVLSPQLYRQSNKRLPTAWLTGLVCSLIAVFGFWSFVRQQPDVVSVADQPSGNENDADTRRSNTAVLTDAVSTNRESPDLTAADEHLPPPLPTWDWPAAAPARQTETVPAVVAKDNPHDQSIDYAELTVPATDLEMVAFINEQISQSWNDLRVSPSAPATDYTWVRRVYLDLAGRIPTIDEVERFAQSTAVDKDQQLVEQLLSDEEFAVQWATRWTNLLVGRHPNERVDRQALLAFLKNSLQQPSGWDGVVQSLIAAEGDPRENGAANFLVAHLNNQAVPATAFVARTLLGTQIHCAQCHKHPFYEVTQQEFWELNSFFKQAKVVSQTTMKGAEADEPAGCYLTDENIGGPTYYETRAGVMKVAYPRFQGVTVPAEGVTSRRQELARLLTTGSDPLISRAFVNRTWSQFFGYGFTAPVDDMGPHNPSSHPLLFAVLTKAFTQADYDPKSLIRWICLSQPYRLSSQLTAQNAQDQPEHGEIPAFSRMYFKPLSPEQLYNSLVSMRGNQPQRSAQWEQHLLARENWVGQFVDSLQNDENDEANLFEGTISQALVLMNGELVEQTISPHQNSVFIDLLGASLSDTEKFEKLCLSVLARKPRPEELALFRKLSRPLREAESHQERGQMLASRLEDVLWAYLNSNEFITNH